MREVHRRTAQLSWLPFVVRLLDSGLSTVRSAPLPAGDPAALTREAVEAVREVVTRGVWAWLVRRGGWRRTRFVERASNRVREGRLWEAPDLASTPLAFSEDSVRLLLAAFRAAGSDGLSRPGNGSGTPEANGDLLLDHLVFRRFLERPPEGGTWTAPFAGNPLSVLTHPHLFEPGRPLPKLLARLLKDDLIPFLPWLADDWARCWLRSEPERFRDFGSLESFSRRRNRVWRTWTELLVQVERCDILLPFLAFWARVEWTPAARSFGALTADRRLEERAALAEPWIESIELGLRCREIGSEVRSLHPIDREAAHQLFLTAYGEHDFDRVAEGLDRRVRELRPTLG